MGHFGTKSPAAATTNKIDRDTMTPSSTLDLFMLTFNCAKNLINVPVFSSHLHAALQQNATSLPDLVVLSLQEVAPLSYAFIGNYFLNPYYARYENALNLASARLLATSPSGSEEVLRDGRQAPPYTLVRAKNVGMTSILLFARDPTAVGPIEEAECGFGAADMGNKGAVGFRVTWASPNHGSSPTELTFVAAHLAAMEWNLKKRNANWRSIVSGLTFSNPRFVLPGVFPPSRESSPMPDRSGAGDTAPTTPVLSTSPTFSSVDSSEAEEEANQPLLSIENEASHFSPHLSPEQAQTLQSTSIFKPTSHLFLAGDLNYRISSSTPPPSAPFPSFDPSSDHYFPSFLPRDQLTQERLAGRAFHGMEEAPITFGPTYKFDILPKIAANKAVNSAAVASGATVNGVPEVPWRFAPHRWPGWCDRVLFLEPPSASTQKKERNKMDVKAYDAFPVLETSDHRPVFLRVKVPLLSAQEMLARSARAEEEQEEEEGNEDGTKFLDPRVKMPVPVDVDAWERRAAARKKEVVVGWSAFLWSTREGAMVLSATLMVLVGGWWLLRAW